MIRFYSRKIAKRILVKLGLRNHVNHKSIRRNLEIISIQPKLELVVYWKVLPNGKGPAVVLQAYKSEIMKFDCFGKEKGHYHIAPDYGTRTSFKEELASEQIIEAGQELLTSAQKYISIQTDSRIKKIEIKKEKFIEAIRKAGKKMNYFIQTVPELKDLQ